MAEKHRGRIRSSARCSGGQDGMLVHRGIDEAHDAARENLSVMCVLESAPHEP